MKVSDKDKKSYKKQKPKEKTTILSYIDQQQRAIDTFKKENSNIISSKSSQAFSALPVVAELKEQRAFILAKNSKQGENRSAPNNFELRMFSSEVNIYGKAFNQLIRANSYKSNIC